jgi:YVTN family beta-propeller protein
MRALLAARMGFALLLVLCAAAQAAPFAYISDSGSNAVSVIDTASNSVVATIAVGMQPIGVAVNATATRVYVTNRGANTVAVIDAANNSVIAAIPVSAQPTGVAVNRAGTRVYVANFGANGLTVIDATRNAVVAVVTVGDSPFGVAVNPAGTRVYVANRADGTVSVVDAITDTVVATVGVGFEPNGVAVSADGSRVYVGSTAVFGVTVIDAATNTVVGNLSAANGYAYAVATDSANSRVYSRTVDTAVTVNEDVGGAPAFWRAGVGAGPGGIAVTAGDTRLYAVNSGDDSVSVIDVATRAVIATIPVGTAPIAFGQFIGPTGNLSTNYQGLWWASGGTESGWGVNFAHSGDRIFATWYTYDTSGKAWWLSMLATRTTPTSNVYSGPIYADTGPSFDNFLGAGIPAQVGTGTLTFADANSGSFAYTIGTTLPPTAQTKAIARYDLATGPQPTCVYSAITPNFAAATNYQDLWWAANGAEPGWGVNFAHQGDTLFATWYTYDVDGTPLWLSALAPRVGGNVYRGPLYRTSGPRFDGYNAALVLPVPVGTATFTFADGDHATFDYTTSGAGGLPVVTQSKEITRFAFAPSGGTLCF